MRNHPRFNLAAFPDLPTPPTPAPAAFTLGGRRPFAMLVAALALSLLAATPAAAQVDISVTKDDGMTYSHAGETLIYTIVVSAAGTGVSGDPSVGVTDTFPTDLTGCSWTSVCCTSLRILAISALAATSASRVARVS